MKKALTLIVTLAMAVNLTGCGSNSADKQTTAESSAESEEAAAAQATASAGEANAQEPELILKYGELNSEDNIITQVGYKFAEYVDELSDGRIKIEVYPSGALGNEKASLQALESGEGPIDIYRGNTNTLTGYGFQKLNMFGLPYIFKDREGMWKVLEDEELGQAFLKEGTEIGANMMGLFYTDEGPRNLFTAKEISGLEDIKNKRIRVPESVLMMDTISALGAQPIPLSFEEVYNVLQAGEVDGAENPIPGYVSNKFYEVAPYYLMSHHVYSPGVVLMAENKWNALSEEDKEILLEAGRMASEWNKQEIVAEEERLLNQMEELGVTIIEMTPEEEAEARADEEIVRVSFTPGLEYYLNRIMEVQG